MPSATPVVFVGLGPIGRSALAHALARRGLRIAGACDADPALAGKKLSELVSGGPARLCVLPHVAQLDVAPPGAVAIVCTSSSLRQSAPAFETLLQKGFHVVSSCEELVFPHFRNRAWVRRADALARRRRVAILGTGVNPGFVLDLLPAVLTGPCLAVRAIKAQRVVDAAARRGPLQRKVGAGRSIAEFRTEVAGGRLGHVGLPESAELLCHALGFGRPKIEQAIEPVVAGEAIETPFVRVEPGEVAGLDHRLTASAARGRVELRLQMYLGAKNPMDDVEIDGEGGTPGDLATVAALLNAAPRMGECRPGLRTVLDAPFPLCRALS
jgi:4-hydroxy-tetrahydrodipicolinate reductase